MKPLSFCVALLLSTSAHAADLAGQAPIAPEVEALPVDSWDGAYIGGLGGVGWLRGKYTSTIDHGTWVQAIQRNRTTTGGLFGAFAGYNFQLENHVVLGIEGDLYYNWSEDSIRVAEGFEPEVGMDWAGSVRARAGYEVGDALIYAAGGWTTARAFIDVPNDSSSAKDRKRLDGYTIGGGVDYKFDRNIFVRAEYRFNDYGSERIRGTKFDDQQHQLIFGLGYKF